jgi:hypothetical protein
MPMTVVVEARVISLVLLVIFSFLKPLHLSAYNLQDLIYTIIAGVGGPSVR